MKSSKSNKQFLLFSIVVCVMFVSLAGDVSADGCQDDCGRYYCCGGEPGCWTDPAIDCGGRPSCTDSCSSCFLPGTPIILSNGSQVPIEDVKVGDTVLGYDEFKKEYINVTVLELESPIRKDYYTIKFEDGTELNVTNEHPIYINNSEYQGWASIIPEITLLDAGMDVKPIKRGDYVFKQDNWVKIIGIVHIVEEVQTYNLKKVSNTNTFFAGGVLVHNKGDPPPPPPPPCVPGAWTNTGEIRCSGTKREQKQTRSPDCGQGSEQWVSDSCPSGFFCKGGGICCDSYHREADGKCEADCGALPVCDEKEAGDVCPLNCVVELDVDAVTFTKLSTAKYKFSVRVTDSIDADNLDEIWLALAPKRVYSNTEAGGGDTGCSANFEQRLVEYVGAGWLRGQGYVMANAVSDPTQCWSQAAGGSTVLDNYDGTSSLLIGPSNRNKINNSIVSSYIVEFKPGWNWETYNVYGMARHSFGYYQSGVYPEWNKHAEFLVDPDNDQQLCEAMGYSWSGGECCGDDSSEFERYSWGNRETGCCEKAEQCLVLNNGNKNYNDIPENYFLADPNKSPVCISDTQYIIDNMCEQGNWTSRTRNVALELLQKANNDYADDYVVFCEDPRLSLNYITKIFPDGEIASDYLLNTGECDYSACLGKFCVLTGGEGNIQAIGSSLNPNMTMDKLYHLLGYSKDCDDVMDDENKFKKCQDGNLWYNHKQRSFVYGVENEGDVLLPVFANWKNKFNNLLRTPSDDVLNHIFNPLPSNIVTFMDKAHRFDRIYVSNINGKTVLARTETTRHDGSKFALLYIEYGGFNTDMCKYSNDIKPESCENVPSKNSHLIHSFYEENDPIFGYWRELTGGLRVQP